MWSIVPERKKPQIISSLSGEKMRLEIEGEIAKGAFAVLKRCKLTSKGRKSYAVIKKAKSKKDVEKIEDEAEMLEKIKGPFVISLIAQVTMDKETCIVVEQCHTKLQQFFKQKDEKLTLQARAKIIIHLMAGILSALDTIHSMGYIHRDISPSNLLITRDGIPKISDFGLCVHEECATNIVGTPYFIDPHAVKYGGQNDLSDVFSFGVCLASFLGPYTARYMFWDYSWKDLVQLYRSGSEEALTGLGATLKMCFLAEVWGRNYDLMSATVDFERENRPDVEELITSEVFRGVIRDWGVFLNSKEPSQEFLLDHKLVLTYIK